jgi:chemotaxis protein histidine kinase CheA
VSDPSDENDEALAEQLRELRVEYLADGAERLAELRAWCERAAGGEAKALQALLRALHRLAGSGGSYGFPEITERSRDAEAFAQRLGRSTRHQRSRAASSLRSSIEAIGAAFDAARRNLDATQDPS